METINYYPLTKKLKVILTKHNIFSKTRIFYKDGNNNY